MSEPKGGFSPGQGLHGLTKRALAKVLFARRFRGAELQMEEVATGVWRGKGVRAEEVKVGLRAEGVTLENSRLVLLLEAEAAFSIPRLRRRTPRTFRTGAVPGRVATPTVGRLNLSFLTQELGVNFVLSSIEAEEANADVAPVKNVAAGASEVAHLVADDVGLPPIDLSPLALQLGRMTLERLGASGATISKMRVGRLGTERPLKIKDVEVKGASLVGARVGEMAGGELDLDFEVKLPRLKLKSFPDLPAMIDRLITRFWIEIKPTLVVHIGNLRLEGLTISTEVGRLKVKDLSVPLTVSGIKASGLEVDEFGAAGVEISDIEEG